MCGQQEGEIIQTVDPRTTTDRSEYQKRLVQIRTGLTHRPVDRRTIHVLVVLGEMEISEGKGTKRCGFHGKINEVYTAHTEGGQG